jgi:hypothetical protein
MSITIELSPEDEAMLRAEAAREGRTVEDVAADRLTASYARARAEAQAVMNGGFRRLGEADAELRTRHGLPDLSALTPEEFAARVNAAVAGMTPEKRAELFEAEPEA